jgi:HAE1 family hydrophobic/amphiphilic exporter-1
VREVQVTLFEGALLTVLVVFLFLNSWRSTVITGLALPVSVLASFIAVWVFGFTLNTMSLLGLSLAIGILIDDAIVVRENIVRHVEMGKDHVTAAHEGTDEIGLAVTATTLSILAVFVPIAFLPGIAGQWFKPFGLTMACAVAVSLLVSFSLDPMLSAYWPDPHRAEGEKSWITRQLDKFNGWFGRRAQQYKRVIAWALDHRRWCCSRSAPSPSR